MPYSCSCTHTATVGVKALTISNGIDVYFDNVELKRVTRQWTDTVAVSIG